MADKTYDPEKELKKGPTVKAMSFDPTQKIAVLDGKVTVGGKPGIVEITGIATGKTDNSFGGTVSIWLSIFRFMRPDCTVDHVAGWNIQIPLAKDQTPEQTADAFAKYINLAPTRPYIAQAEGGKLSIFYHEKVKPEDRPEGDGTDENGTLL